MKGLCNCQQGSSPTTKITKKKQIYIYMVDNIYVHIIPYNRQDFKQYVQPLFVKF